MPAVTFAIGILIGAALCALSLKWPESKEEKGTYQEKTGIDPDELVAWLENYTANYEYLSPPTTGEITRKIREMEEEANEHT